jgi:serine phosphatase RsbU (regulator of sigma subunit)
MKSLSYQLNFNHLLFLAVSLIVLIFGNFLILDLIINKRVENKVQQKGGLIYDYFISNNQPTKELDSKQLKNQIQHYYFSSSEGCLLYNSKNSQAFVLSGKRYNDEVHLSDELHKFIRDYKDKSPNVLGVDLMDGGKHSFVYVAPLKNQHEIFFIFYAGSGFIENLGHYPAWYGAMFGLVSVVALWLIISVNRRIAAPYSDIAQSVLKRTESSAGISGKQSESMLLKRAVNLMQSQLLFYEKNIEKSSHDQQKFENDIKIARSLQKRILPKDIGKQLQDSGVEIKAKSEALFEVGGDFYDYYMLDEKHLLFTIGDVAGKGIPASLFMIFAQTTMRSIAQAGMNAGEIVTKLNERIIEENVSDLFFTLFLGIINIQTGALQYCNAAHNLPILIKSSGSLDELTNIHGIPVGIYGNKIYGYSEIKLNDDDQIAVYTDGLIDTIDENEMDYSVDVLKYNLLGAWFLSPGEIINKIFASVTGFRGNAKAVDDMTILALKYSKQAKNTL